MKYSFKDILIGFRREYLDIRNKLNEIEKDIKILDQTLSKCIILFDDDNKRINCYFIELEKKIISAIIYIEDNLGIPLYNFNNLVYDSNINSVYHFKNDLKHYHILIENTKEFNKKVINLLNCKFQKMMKKNMIETMDNNKYYIFDYNYSSFNQETNDNYLGLTNIEYYSNKDFIKLQFLGKLSNELFQNELNVKYDSNLFNDYQKELIEKERKDILLFEDNTISHEFNIQEEDKKIILIKR